MHMSTNPRGISSYAAAERKQGVLQQDVVRNLRKLMGIHFPAIISKFIATSSFYMSHVENGIVRGNAALVIENIHPLRSSSAALGAKRVAELAQALETCCRMRKKRLDDLSDLFPLLEEIKSALKDAETALKAEIADIPSIGKFH